MPRRIQSRMSRKSAAMPIATDAQNKEVLKLCRAVAIAPIFFLLLAPVLPLQAQSHPIPPGVRQADQAEAQSEKNIPPPVDQRRNIDLAKLDREAGELAALAQTVPGDLISIRRGILPKDTIQKLKQIEKLAKHLRSQITPQN